MDSQKIVTHEFRVPLAKIMMMRARTHAMAVVGSFLLPVVAAVCLGIWLDMRWLVVALMLVFIAFPMVMAYLFIWHMLRPGLFVNTIPHTVSMEGEQIKVKTRVSVRDEKEDESREPQEEFQEEIREHDYTFRTARRRIYPKGLALHLSDDSPGLLFIPWDAFRSLEDSRTACQL